MNLRDRIVELFEEIIQKVSGDKNYSLKSQKTNKSIVDSFITLLDEDYGIESVGEYLLYQYFSFQLNYWCEKDTRFGKKFQLGWFIGKKAYERWQNKTELELYHSYKTASKYNFYYKHKTGSFVDDKIREYEEIEKKRFDGDERIANCLQTTTLYHPKSINCIRCSEKKLCKELLKENYPNIYILRGLLK